MDLADLVQQSRAVADGQTFVPGFGIVPPGLAVLGSPADPMVVPTVAADTSSWAERHGGPQPTSPHAAWCAHVEREANAGNPKMAAALAAHREQRERIAQFSRPRPANPNTANAPVRVRAVDHRDFEPPKRPASRVWGLRQLFR